MVRIAIRSLVLAVFFIGCHPGRVHDGVDTGNPSTIAEVPVVQHVETQREAVIRIARGEVGQLEVGGNNHGPGPSRYLASVGLLEGHPYCAAAQYWVLDSAGVVLPGKRALYARAAFWHEAGHRLTDTVPALPADFTGYYYKGLGRIGHTEILVGESGKMWAVIGFNTTNGISRDGQGVFEKVILKSQVSCVSRWIE